MFKASKLVKDAQRVFEVLPDYFIDAILDAGLKDIESWISIISMGEKKKTFSTPSLVITDYYRRLCNFKWKSLKSIQLEHESDSVVVVRRNVATFWIRRCIHER